MYEKLKNVLRNTDMLYIVEDRLDEDYHLMPFRIICDHMRLSDFEKAWDTYLDVKPNIILIHVMVDYQNVIEFIEKLRKINNKSTVIVLTSKELVNKLEKIEKLVQKLLTYPIGADELIYSLEHSVYYEGLYYYVTKTLMFDPSRSALFMKDQQINLTKKEVRLLTLLIQNKERIVTYSEIEHYVWGDEGMNLNTLTSIVRNIRKKADLNDIIVNYSRQGYQVGKV